MHTHTHMLCTHVRADLDLPGDYAGLTPLHHAACGLQEHVVRNGGFESL